MRGEVGILPAMRMRRRRGEAIRGVIIRVQVRVRGIVVKSRSSPWRGLWRIIGIIMRPPVVWGTIRWTIVGIIIKT